MSNPLDALRESQPERVRTVLNLLVETPYFYRDDDEEAFFFLRRHRHEFAAFHEEFYGWKLVMDDRCARVYKAAWYNRAVTEANRDLFGFRSRDECIGFMVLLEFFENQLDENAMTVEDRDNLRFRVGDFLAFAHRRFQELLPPETAVRYTEEFVRANVLRRILPVLERYRLLYRVPPPPDLQIGELDAIFEALPALYHYNATRLSGAIAGKTAETIADAAAPDAPPGEREP